MAIERSKDQREFGRRAVFKPAVLVLDNGQRVEGSILDHSEGGARIKVPAPETIQGEFFLEMPSDDLVIRCRIVRVEDGVTGVQFVKPPRRLSWLKK